MESLFELLETITFRIRVIEMQGMLTGILLWLVLSIVAGILAAMKGRGFWTYFAVALFASPLIGLIVVGILKDWRAAQIAEIQRRLSRLDGEVVVPTENNMPRVLQYLALAVFLIVVIVGGIVQLGSSANTTFNTISGEIDVR